MEFGLSHVVIAALAFVVGISMRRKPAARVPEVTPPANAELPSAGERLFKIVFLAGWLMAWTVGIMMAGGMFLGTLGQEPAAAVFVGGWLVAAIAGWVWAVVTLIRMLQGRPDAFRSLRNNR